MKKWIDKKEHDPHKSWKNKKHKEFKNYIAGVDPANEKESQQGFIIIEVSEDDHFSVREYDEKKDCLENYKKHLKIKK